jgi:DNA-binding transcriptional LysR family regulator
MTYLSGFDSFDSWSSGHGTAATAPPAGAGGDPVVQPRGAAPVHHPVGARAASRGWRTELGVRLVDRIGKRNELTPMGRRRRSTRAAWCSEARSARAPGAAGPGPHAQPERGAGLGAGRGADDAAAVRTGGASAAGARRWCCAARPSCSCSSCAARELDALVIDARRVAPATDLRIEPLGQLRAAFICRRGHPLARRRRVAFEDAAGATPWPRPRCRTRWRGSSSTSMANARIRSC